MCLLVDSIGPLAEGYESEGVYAQVREDGLTNLTPGVDETTVILAQIGFGDPAEDPMMGESWAWTSANANANYGPDSPGYAEGFDEYVATLVAPVPGLYDVAARFSVDGGQTWTLCDFDGSLNGYTSDAAGTLIVARTPVAGELAITEILYDPSAVGDSAGEWFEVQNVSNEALSLVGLSIYDDGSDNYALDAGAPWSSGAVIPAGGFALFGKSGDSMANGGAAVTYDMVLKWLWQFSDELVLSNASGIIDRVIGPGEPSLMRMHGCGHGFGSCGCVNLLSSDGSGKWCAAVDAFGAGDLGTPGSANPCPSLSGLPSAFPF